jgi:hypothetical protein
MRFLLGVVSAAILILPSWGMARAQNPDGRGLQAEIMSIAIPGTRRPVVTFKITDNEGAPLKLEDVDRGLRSRS